MQKNSIDIIFPVGGVVRTMGYQNQAPYTCVDALNVWPFDAEEGRARGGSRNGTRKAYFTDCGNAVRMLSQLDHTQTVTNRKFTDGFDSDGLGANWEVIGSTPILDVSDEYATLTSQQTGAAALTSLGIDTSSVYSVGVYVAPYRHAFHGIVRVYLRMDSTPVPTTEGVIIEVAFMGDAIVATLLSYTGSVETVVDTYFGLPQSYADGSWLRAKVSGTTVTVTWGITELLSGTVDAHSGQRVGMGATCLDPSGRVLIEQFRVDYFVTGAAKKKIRYLMAAASGNIHYESNSSGEILDMESPLFETLTLASDNDLIATQYGQLLYIMDHSDAIAEGTGTVNGTSFDSASYTDWTTDTTLGAAFTTAAADDYAVEILTVAASTATIGSYSITAVAAGNLTLGSSGSTASTSCTFRIVRVPKIYSPLGSPARMSRWVATTGKGTVPNGTIVVRYRERAFVAGGLLGIQWFMSRQGDFADWNYGGSLGDAKRSISGSLADAGVPGDQIVAAAASNDDYLLVWCPTSTWIIVGDPAYTGQIKNVSETIGCVGAKAWCHGPSGSVYWLSRAGLAMMGAGFSTPQLLSQARIPRELLNVNAALYTVSLVYDIGENRVYIFITDPDSNRSGRHWCYDVRTESFWPLFFPAASQPTSAFYYTSDLPDDSCVILGCRDGYLRRFDRYCDTDDGNSFDSFVFYGPIQLGSGYVQGRIDEMIADVALDSRDVSWELRVGDNPEEAFWSTTAAASGTWSAGMNHKVRPRRRGGGFCIKVGRFASQTAGWAMERITVLRAALGKRR